MTKYQFQTLRNKMNIFTTSLSLRDCNTQRAKIMLRQ